MSGIAAHAVRIRHRGRVATVLATLAALFGASIVASAPAWAATPEVPGSAWLGGHGVNVCYPVGTPCAGTTEYPGESWGGAYNWQCEELAARLWTTSLGWYTAGWTTYAYQLYGGLSSAQVSYHPNNGSYVPVPGDLVVHGANDGFAESAGHVAVVNYVDASLGIHVVEQNVDPAYESFPATPGAPAQQHPGQALYSRGSVGWTRYGTSAKPIGFVHANRDPYTNGPSAAPIVNQAHGLCLDAAAQTDTQNGGIVQLWQCVGDGNQQWVRVGNAIESLPAGLCLDANWGTDASNGGKVQLWSCNGGPNQQWLASGAELVNAAHGLCLDANWGTDANNGGVVQLWSCNGGPNQLWANTPPAPAQYGPYHVVLPGGGTLYVRSGPGQGYPAVGSLPAGAVFYAYCQAPGSTVNGNAWWDRLTTGGYVSDYYTSTPGAGPPESGIPQC